MIKRTIQISVAVLLVTILTVLAQPVSFVLQGGGNLPAPSGEYGVGRTRLALLDTNRDDVFTEAPNDKRELVINIFYPAEVTASDSVGPYVEASGWQSVDGVPAFLVSPVTPNFVYDAPAVADSFPVLLFGAGFAGPVSYYTSLIEDMVSHGYIVIAVEHTYHFTDVYFPDGRVAHGSDFGLNDGIYDTEAAKVQLSAELVKDMQYALDMADELNTTHHALAGRLDLTQVGAFGHSFGGQTAAALALVDDRVQAAVNLDGSIVDPRIIGYGVTVPYLLVFDDFAPQNLDYFNGSVESWWQDFAARNYPSSLQHSGAPFHVVQLKGAQHGSFYTDLVQLKPMFPFVINSDLVGDLPFFTVLPATSTVMRVFFDAYLSGDVMTTKALANSHVQLRPGFDTSNWGITIETDH